MFTFVNIRNDADADKTVIVSRMSDRICQYWQCRHFVTDTECPTFRLHCLKCRNQNFRDFFIYFRN